MVTYDGITFLASSPHTAPHASENPSTLEYNVRNSDSQGLLPYKVRYLGGGRGLRRQTGARQRDGGTRRGSVRTVVPSVQLYVRAREDCRDPVVGPHDRSGSVWSRIKYVTKSQVF